MRNACTCFVWMQFSQHLKSENSWIHGWGNPCVPSADCVKWKTWTITTANDAKGKLVVGFQRQQLWPKPSPYLFYIMKGKRETSIVKKKKKCKPKPKNQKWILAEPRVCQPKLRDCSHHRAESCDWQVTTDRSLEWSSLLALRGNTVPRKESLTNSLWMLTEWQCYDNVIRQRRD